MTNIKGKWALVTGASRGMGRQAAKFLAEQGCNVILHSRSLEHTASLLEEIKALGVEAAAVAAELSDLSQVGAMLSGIDAMGRQIDIVLNNAAVQIAYRTDWLTTPAEDYTTSFVINTTAPMMICYHFLPGMIQRGFGRIVNTTSGIDKEPQQAGYSASKAALDKVTRDLGTTVEGTDVIISLADPGWCRTDLGGPNAPNSVESAMPGIVLGVFVDDGRSGRIFHAQDYCGMTLDQALEAVNGK
ncbi:MAG: SDR family oxidoreductase [Ruminococcaceae bacterium]|nr:SDR family oxidoreductase [Oscillospiraceae bacterium]